MTSEIGIASNQLQPLLCPGVSRYRDTAGSRSHLFSWLDQSARNLCLSLRRPSPACSVRTNCQRLTHLALMTHSVTAPPPSWRPFDFSHAPYVDVYRALLGYCVCLNYTVLNFGLLRIYGFIVQHPSGGFKRLPRAVAPSSYWLDAFL